MKCSTLELELVNVPLPVVEQQTLARERKITNSLLQISQFMVDTFTHKGGSIVVFSIMTVRVMLFSPVSRYDCMI